MAGVAGAKLMSFVLTRDRAVAKPFYETVLGLTLIDEDSFAAVFDCHGIMLRLSTQADFVAQAHTVLGWEVPDIAATMRELTERGVRFEIFDGFGQDAAGVWTTPDGKTKVAWFKDPDGNVLSLTQF